MVARFYSIQYGADPSGPVVSAVAAGGTTRHIELKLEMGANNASPEGIHLKTNRASVLAAIRQFADQIESGKIPWPPAYS